MKYKVGDKVKVRDDLVVDYKYGSDAFVDGMSALKGKVVTIKTCFTSRDKYAIEGSDYAWTDEMFEDDSEEIAKFRAFLEEVADYRSDEYMEQYLRLSYIMGIGEVDDDEKMDEAVNKLCDFYKTFTPTKETKKKMTKAEIEDALGYKIEIVEE
jgi:hypothetical protein